MKIHRGNNKWYYRIGASFVAVVVVMSLVLVNWPRAQASGLNQKYDFIKTNYSVPSTNVVWVAPDGNDNAAGTESAPLATFKKALSNISDGGTVVAKSGIYREPHFLVSKNNITIQAAPGAEVWLKGSDVIATSAWTKEGGIWKTTGNYQNFCHVCTTNSNPSIEGMAAYPEQVFINDQAMEQVATKAEVTAGSNKFYVEDTTPTTLKVSGNNSQGYNIGAQDRITYYLGTDPTAGTTEISQRGRALTSTGANFKLRGINVAQYAPHQVWGFGDPVLGDTSGPVMLSINGSNSVVQDVIVAQSATLGLFLDGGQGTVVKDSHFLDNGSNGAGANRSQSATFENNTFSNNNAYGFETKGSICGAYCGIADVKVTHMENVTFRGNVFDYSKAPYVSSNAATAHRYNLPGVWCDEGCVNAKIVNNFFTNTQVAIFYEVSDSGIIASNIIESAGSGISVSGSSNTKIYNNTISRTFYPIRIREDDRIDGCNYYDNTAKTCTSIESWSKDKGLSWDVTGLEVYNNIISSRAVQDGDSTGPYWAYAIRTEGNTNQDGTVIDTNDMFKGIDYNVYYRNDTTRDKTILTWDLKEVMHPLNILFSNATEVSADSRVNQSIDGLERHAIDLSGSRVNNPIFVREATLNTDYNMSDYTLKSSSPAAGTGKPLSAELASAIDPSGATVTAGSVVNRGALINARMSSGSSTPQPPTAPVSIPDPNLKAAINKTLGVGRAADQDVTVEEIARITHLNASHSSSNPDSTKITNLSGLDKAVNLEGLYIDGNSVTDLTPLENLSKLSTITMINNSVTSLAPLSGLDNLKIISASGNSINSTSPLSGLSRLEQVNLGTKGATLNIADIAASSSTLTRLQFSDYSKTSKITNSSQLASLTKVASFQVSGIPLSTADVSAIGGMTQLTALRLDNSTVYDLTPLVNLTNLTSLRLDNNGTEITATAASFASPVKDARGAAIGITANSDLANDVTAGQIKVVSPVYDGQTKALRATWSRQVTIGNATATFSGQLTANVTLAAADKTALNTQIARAESQPDYIKNDSAVKVALAAAKQIQAANSPSASDIADATNRLKQALDAAIAKEQAAQAAAEAAVAKAETSQDPDDVTDATNALAAVQESTKKQALQNRLNTVTAKISQARTDLNTLIAKAKDPATTAGMSSSTTAALANEITKAEQVAGNSDTSVAELNAAKVSLQAKIDALRADLSGLQRAIASAEAEPSYIRVDSAVQVALTKAKTVASQANPSTSDIQTAAASLNQAVAAAKQKEQAAQTAAEAAVAKAETDKTQASVDAAKALVAKVQDPTKKQALQARLDAITITLPPSPTPTPTTSATISQAGGGTVTVSTSGSTCYNLASAKAATAPSRYNRRVLRDIADFTIDCANQTAATGYTTQVTLTLSRLYRNTARLTVAKLSGGIVKADITQNVTFGTTSDGKYTTITYSLTDGGFGDQDNTANGTIIDPVGIYEEEDANAGGRTGTGTGGGANSSTTNVGLAETGDGVYVYIIGSIVLLTTAATSVYVTLRRRA